MPSANAGIVTGKWTGDPQLVKTQLQLNYEANGPVEATEAKHSDWAGLQFASQFMVPI
jgi:hypothetical protein